MIPNYVKQEKFDILTWAGMNRVRMGIQSGSQEILDFYKRPTPPARILQAGEVIASYAPKYHIPPAYDIIVDNPIETRENVVETLELLYKIDRPYTLFIYSLKVIPNTDLERAMTERGVDMQGIDAGYLIVPPRAANLLLYVLAHLEAAALAVRPDAPVGAGQLGAAADVPPPRGRVAGALHDQAGPRTPAGHGLRGPAGPVGVLVLEAGPRPRGSALHQAPAEAGEEVPAPLGGGGAVAGDGSRGLSSHAASHRRVCKKARK